MRTIGLVGGTGWLSTAEYYRLINEGVNARLGGHESARCLLYSFNFGDIMRLKARAPDQAAVGPAVVEAAMTLEKAGAACIALCANTLHWFADDVEAAVRVPVVHIAAATAAEIHRRGFTAVGLLGTRPTMEQAFYKDRLRREGIDTLTPSGEDRTFIDGAIFGELVRGTFRPETKARFLEVVRDLVRRGASGVILGCTEIPLLIGPDDTDIPLFDTLRIHCEAIVDFALAGSGQA